ncbi:hypothetical protein RHVG_00015 [Rhodovulum phage RS1]|uniref:hypothetical protein n=1 Tax=Rhodobacter phage RC1 TaxID=754055 RepID=UPI0002C185A2|nr:hypothetical protein RHWG_00041 [Rhodobacter phage RC1]YP_007676394.1 hypothetical protein RHVG_00015 [Rhodovulum phage RS1]AGH57980.1 hypothetical protein RHVG_00015 [Rhodovulum phage RS1]AGH58062.1 hypothetical protein RHWG_00041 [Rhodobacter phage RC1]
MSDIDQEDAIAIGTTIVEMADRVKTMDLVCPGTAAEWNFELDDQRFDVKVTVAVPKNSIPEEET